MGAVVLLSVRLRARVVHPRHQAGRWLTGTGGSSPGFSRRPDGGAPGAIVRSPEAGAGGSPECRKGYRRNRREGARIAPDTAGRRRSRASSARRDCAPRSFGRSRGSARSRMRALALARRCHRPCQKPVCSARTRDTALGHRVLPPEVDEVRPAERSGEQVEIGAGEIRVPAAELGNQLVERAPHHSGAEDAVWRASSCDRRLHVGPIVKCSVVVSRKLPLVGPRLLVRQPEVRLGQARDPGGPKKPAEQRASAARGRAEQVRIRGSAEAPGQRTTRWRRRMCDGTVTAGSQTRHSVDP